MPCGSTISNSINSLDAASPAFPDLGWSWKNPLARLVGIIPGWQRRWRYREILELDDRLLADIGLWKTGVEEVRSSPLYLLAWRDSK
jgi:uncharacterized protein YjiS (DUF1127 family)